MMYVYFGLKLFLSNFAFEIVNIIKGFHKVISFPKK